MRGLHEEIKVDQAFVPKSRSSANTLYNDLAIGSAVGIDCKGFEEVLIAIACGAIGATTLTVEVGFADVDDAEDASFALVSGASQAIVDADDDKEFVMRVKSKDVGRYCFVKVTQADAVACIYGISVLLGGAKEEPVTQSQTVAFTDE